MAGGRLRRKARRGQRAGGSAQQVVSIVQFERSFLIHTWLQPGGGNAGHFHGTVLTVSSVMAR